MNHFKVLETLLNVSNKILGSFISKNKFETEEKKLYSFIKENKKTINEGLFLIPTHSINALEKSPSFDKSETQNYLHQIEMINLAIFAYNVYEGKEYETCINNFFTSIMNKEDEPIETEIEFYVKLRHIALAAYCEENKNTDMSKAIELFFPQGYEKLYFSSGNNYKVILALDSYRQNLLTQSMEEIIDIPALSNDNASPLRDFIGNRYQKLEHKLRDTLKRKNEEEPSAKKKVKTSNTYIVTPEAGESEKAKVARMFNNKSERRKITRSEALYDNNVGEIIESGDEDPVVLSSSDSSEEEEDQQHEEDGARETPTAPAVEEDQQHEEDGARETPAAPAEEEVNQLTVDNNDDESRSDVSRSENSRENSEIFSPANETVTLKKKIRKQNKPWSKEEVQALENGLRKFRRPYWSCIIEYADPVLNERTGVNVKDKARTMIRELERRGCTEPDHFGPYKFVKNPDRNPKYDLIKK